MKVKALLQGATVKRYFYLTLGGEPLTDSADNPCD